MSEESIDILLSARDEASSIFRKTSAELELLRDRVEQTSNSAKKGTDVVDKFARMLGLGDFANVAQDAKDLASGVGDAAKALKGGGAGALAMKAGLAGITAVVSYKVGEVIAEWVFEAKKFGEELQKSTEKASELDAAISKATAARFDKQIDQIKLYGGTFREQAKAAEGVLSQLSKEIEGKAGQEEYAKRQLEKLESQRSFLIASAEEVEMAKQQLEGIQNQKKALIEKSNELRQQYSEAEAHALRQKELADKLKTGGQRESALKDEILALTTTEKQYELHTKLRDLQGTTAESKVRALIEEKHAIKERIESEKLAAEAQKKADEQRKKDQEEIAKIQERSRQKQLDAEIKGADKSVKEIEKQIGDLEKIKIDVSNPSLTSKDERMTSLGRGTGDIQFQQLEQAKRQVKIAELQQKLMAEIARYQRLIAEKEDPILAIGG